MEAAWVSLLAGGSDDGSGSRDEQLGVGAAFLVDGIVYALVGAQLASSWCATAAAIAPGPCRR